MARCGLDVPLSTLGPAIIFHETVHTKLLGSGNSSESVDRLLLERFMKLARFPEAFRSIRYRGTRTCSPPTDFGGLQHTLEQLLDNNSTRSPVVIFKALQALSVRFNGEISDELIAHNCFFPDEYFTCSSLCLSCGHALSAKRSSKTTTPSITAVLVGRGSVTPARPKPRPSQRKAGVWPP